GQKNTASSGVITTGVTEGPFTIYVSATGELKAKKSTKVRGPQSMRSVGIWQTSISNIIPEGTIVGKGEFVAELDKTELASKMQEVQTEIEKIQTQLEQAKIDTTLEMKGIRDEIANLEFTIEQERLEIEKNRYEPEMIIEQSRLKLEKSNRDYDQLTNKLELKKIQSDAKIGEIDANLRQQTNSLTQLSAVAAEFTITAPEAGMLVYEKTWNGKKGPGSQVSGWDPVVAELPDLSEMTSVLYVNEVDISKVKKGQSVAVKIDAFPEKEFMGNINSVANIGQQLRNQDAKVFEVIVQLDQVDSVLRPAMTTSNEILVYSFDKVLSVPLEAYHKDSIEFVVKKLGGKYLKQEVVAHASNDEEIIIVAGLSSNDLVCLTFPDDIAELDVTYLQEGIRSEALEKIKLANADRTKKERDAAKLVKEELASQQESAGSGIIIIN
ncbi:MAG: efflux RND transporter periplasmic adaptor subunit, partial [Saprospiraceae bacterium]|nr:efflux RND transporter periplasmic adaptor subunit [Saprospiraceae bacterium]